MSTATVPQRTAEIDEVKIREPLWPVKSRVSWGALLAGTVIAVVSYSLLALLGVAIAVTFSDRMTADQLGTMSGIWTFVTLLLAMFLGGYISTRFTVGEFKNEAILYGIIVWAVSSVVLIPLSMLGIGTSVGTVLASRGIAKINNDTVPLMVSAQDEFSNRFSHIEKQISHVARQVAYTAKQEASDKSDTDKSESAKSDANKSDSDKNSSDRNSSDTASSSKRDSREEQTSTSDSDNSSSSDDSNRVARRDNSNQDRSSQDRNNQDRRYQDNSNQNANTADNPNSKTAHDKAVSASWFAFGGTLLSMLAAVFGAVVGPTISIVHHKVPVRTTPVVATRTVA